MVLPYEREQPRDVDDDDTEIGSPGHSLTTTETVVGWPAALRLPRDPEGFEDPGSGHGIESLLTRAFGTMGAGALAVRFRSETGTQEFGCPVEVTALLAAETAAGRGPLLESEILARPVDVADFDGLARWPDYAAAALAVGLRAVTVVPLFDETGCIGSVASFDPTRRDFPALVATSRLEALAAHLSVLLANAEALSASRRTVTQLREAMLSRSEIEQAKGVLMARETIDAETAWAYLVKISQRTHRKLRDISADIVAKASTGAL